MFTVCRGPDLQVFFCLTSSLQQVHLEEETPCYEQLTIAPKTDASVVQNVPFHLFANSVSSTARRQCFPFQVKSIIFLNSCSCVEFCGLSRAFVAIHGEFLELFRRRRSRILFASFRRRGTRLVEFLLRREFFVPSRAHTEPTRHVAV